MSKGYYKLTYVEDNGNEQTQFFKPFEDGINIVNQTTSDNSVTVSIVKNEFNIEVNGKHIRKIKKENIFTIIELILKLNR